MHAGKGNRHSIFFCTRNANEEPKMKSYYVLRNNRETGPFTWREIKGMALLPTDLIWIEGESTSWRYPAELDELKELAGKLQPDSQNPSPLTQKKKKAEKPPLFSDYAPITASTVRAQQQEQQPSFEELQKKYAEMAPQRRVWIRPAGVSASFFGVVVFAIGVLMMAVMVRKAIEKFEFQPFTATSEAHEIVSEKLAESSSSHNALATVLPTTQEPTEILLSQNNPSQPAVVQENTQPADSIAAVAQPTRKKEAGMTRKLNSENAAEKRQSPEQQPDTNKIAVAETAAPAADSSTQKTAVAKQTPAEEEKPEKKAPEKKLQVSANNYEVGFLGGINNLELTVKNPSSAPIDKAVIAVEYLKPNGKMVHTETVTVSGLAAGATKKLAVPGSSRGVRVRFHVVSQ